MENQETLPFLSYAEVKSLFDVASKDKSVYHAIVKLLYSSGITTKELTTLNTDDIDFLGEVIHIRKGEHNGKKRITPISSECLAVLISYMEERAKRDPKTRLLFLDEENESIAAEEISAKLAEYSETAGIDPLVSSRVLRNSFSVHMIRNGCDPESIKDILGEEDDQQIARLVQAAKSSEKRA